MREIRKDLSIFSSMVPGVIRRMTSVCFVCPILLMRAFACSRMRCVCVECVECVECVCRVCVECVLSVYGVWSVYCVG